MSDDKQSELPKPEIQTDNTNDTKAEVSSDIEEMRKFMRMHRTYMNTALIPADFDSGLFHRLRDKYESIDCWAMLDDAHTKVCAERDGLKSGHKSCNVRIDRLTKERDAALERVRELEKYIEEEGGGADCCIAAREPLEDKLTRAIAGLHSVIGADPENAAMVAGDTLRSLGIEP